MNAELAGGAAHQEARAAVGEVGMAAARLRCAGAQVAEMLFQRPGNTIRLDHQHRNAVGLSPGTPVSGYVGQVMGNEERNTEIGVVVMQFQSDGDVAVAVIDRPGGDTLEGPCGQCDGKRQAARWQDLAQDRAPFVEADRHVAGMSAQGIGHLLRKPLGVEPERTSGPCRLGNCLQHCIRPCFTIESRFPVFSSGLFVLVWRDNRRRPVPPGLKIAVKKTLHFLMVSKCKPVKVSSF